MGGAKESPEDKSDGAGHTPSGIQKPEFELRRHGGRAVLFLIV